MVCWGRSLRDQVRRQIVTPERERDTMRELMDRPSELLTGSAKHAAREQLDGLTAVLLSREARQERLLEQVTGHPIR